jgi:lipopolysaccharide export system protein LptA
MMNFIGNTRFFLMISTIGLACLLSAPMAAGQALQRKAGQSKGTPTVIKSNSLEIDNKRREVTFAGNVEARKDDMTINCQKMFVYYLEDKAAGGASEKAAFKIDRIVATGEVKINRTDGGLATAEQATYYQSEEKVVLTGKPVVKQGEDFVEGSVITLFLREDRSLVEGSGDEKVRAILSPRSGKW